MKNHCLLLLVSKLRQTGKSVLRLRLGRTAVALAAFRAVEAGLAFAGARVAHALVDCAVLAFRRVGADAIGYELRCVQADIVRVFALGGCLDRLVRSDEGVVGNA